MNKRILVALDDLDSSEFVFEEAISLAKEHQAQLKLLHVKPIQEDSSLTHQKYLKKSINSDISSKTTEEQVSNCSEISSEDKMLGRLASCTKRARALNLNAEYALRIGDPGQTICDLALAWHADLILLGSEEKTSNGASSLDSVRNFVTHNAPCSVEVVRLTCDPLASTLLENETLLAHLSGWQ